mmetsp:Transcript_33775/g.80107  ORF Transcript_33775/g.80107 Transcript_33775/m.80107 type:complete len:165 (+) Transcript_33775:48-542(+)
MPARDAAPTETAKFEVPRGVPLSRDLEGDASAPPAPGVADRSASQEHWRTAAAAVVPSAGNCRRYKNSYWIFDGPCSACGFAKNDTCHQIPHNCLVCGDTFTAVDNQESSCAVHPLPKLKIVGKTSHAVHKYKIFHYDCCPDKTKKCSSEQEFMKLKIPHGHHM